MKVQELINLINNENAATVFFDAEELIKGEFNRVAENLNLDEHRWYIISPQYINLKTVM